VREVPEELITSVSDTARWMAAYRATESARSDSLFDDPLAERFARDRGRAIAAAAPWLMRNGWWWVTRTKLIDDLIAKSVGEGCDRVLNLAAGFDTRPYRLDLPAGIEWVEADVPELISEKQHRLSAEAPRCRLSRVAVDLADKPSRQAFLDEATNGAHNTLVLTEGLLLYLDESQVRGLGQALQRTEIGWWITDLIAPVAVRKMMQQMPSLAKARMVFEPTEGVAFFEKLGWAVSDVRSVLKEAGRWKRLPLLLRPVGYLPDFNPRKLAHAPWSGVVRFTPQDRMCEPQ
jgi:methyltransferase (TIGR00027 family)